MTKSPEYSTSLDRTRLPPRETSCGSLFFLSFHHDVFLAREVFEFLDERFVEIDAMRKGAKLEFRTVE